DLPLLCHHLKDLQIFKLHKAPPYLFGTPMISEKVMLLISFIHFTRWQKYQKINSDLYHGGGHSWVIAYYSEHFFVSSLQYLGELCFQSPTQPFVISIPST